MVATHVLGSHDQPIELEEGAELVRGHPAEDIERGDGREVGEQRGLRGGDELA